MNGLEITLAIYGFIVLVLAWRYTAIFNKLRTQVINQGGVKLQLAHYVPQILRDSFLFPVLIFWYGMEAFIRGLE